MLKKYLQALLEAFVQSKRDWIGRQALPYDNSTKQGLTGASGRIIVPFDGWARVQCNSNGFRVSCGQANITIATPTKSWPSLLIPVQKGYGLDYIIEEPRNEADQFVCFIPNFGSYNK